MTEKKREVLSDLELQNAEAAVVRGGGGTIKPKVDDGDADGITG